MTNPYAEFETFRAAWRHYKQMLHGMGYKVKAVHGLTRWRQLMKRARTDMNPSFDWDANTDINSTVGMTLECIEMQDGEPVANLALRVYENVTDIRQQLASGRLWWGAEACPDREFEYVPLPEEWPLISGNVVQTGGLVVHPLHNGQRLGSILDTMGRCAGVTAWQADHFIGLSKPHIAAKLAPESGYYAIERQALVAKAAPVSDEPVDLYLTHISRGELLQRLLKDCNNGKPANPAVAVNEG